MTQVEMLSTYCPMLCKVDGNYSAIIQILVLTAKEII